MPKSFLIRKKRNHDSSWSKDVDSRPHQSADPDGDDRLNLQTAITPDQKNTHAASVPSVGENVESHYGINSPDSVSEERPSEEFSLNVLSGSRLCHNDVVSESDVNDKISSEKYNEECSTPKKTRKRCHSGIPPSYPYSPLNSFPSFSVPQFPGCPSVGSPPLHNPYMCNVFPNHVPFSPPPSYVRPPLYMLPFLQPQNLSTFPDKVSSPIGVLSPSEIPSPSASMKADEPSVTTGSSVSGRLPYPRNDNIAFVDSSIPQTAHYLSSPVPKIVKTSIEVVNGGFGIRNPLFVSDTDSSTSGAEVSPGWLPKVTMHTCPICGFQSETAKMMQIHLKTHKEIKRFLCSFCGKGFNDTFDLKRHTRTHTGVRPYKCDVCGKGFTQRCSLESHCKKIHGMHFDFAFNERRGKVYVCEDCGHSTNDPEIHYLHLRTTHPNNPAIMKCHDRRQFKFVESIETRLSHQIPC